MSVPVPVMETIDERERWIEAVYEAFKDPVSPTLEVAEQAVRACPGDAALLQLAAVAALLEERPNRCLVFLKRLSKRYVSNASHHLLHALALAQLGRFAPAAALLDRHGLNNVLWAQRFFVGGSFLAPWLRSSLQTIHARKRTLTAQSKRASQRPAAKSGRGRSSAKTENATTANASPPPPASAVPAPPPSREPAGDLPRPSACIPVEFELSLTGAAEPSASPGAGDTAAWFRLRSEFAHLSLLQGFDELLCLSQLRDVDTYAPSSPT